MTIKQKLHLYHKLKLTIMDKIQSLLIDLRMKRATILMNLRNQQENEDLQDMEKTDKLLDTLNELNKGIEIIENHLKNLGK